MRAHLVLEDTPDGVNMNVEYAASGCQDHPPESLTIMLLAGFEMSVKTLARQHALSARSNGIILPHG